MRRSDFWATRKPTSGSGSTLVTPSDTEDLVNPATNDTEFALELRVDGAGTVAFIGADGQPDTWTCVTGDRIDVPVSRVKATGTNATGIHAIW